MAGWWRVLKILWNSNARKGLLEQLQRMEKSGIKPWDRAAARAWLKEHKQEIHSSVCPHTERHQTGRRKKQEKCKKRHP